MALPNEILVGRFNKGLNAQFGMKSGAPSATLGNEILPVYLIDHDAENRNLYGWKRYAFPASVAGAAGTFPVIQIQNPATSGSMAVMEKIVIGQSISSAATQIRLNLGPNANMGLALNATQINPLDRRNIPIGSSSLVAGSGNPISVAGAGQLIYQIVIQPASGVFFQDIQFTEHQEIALFPGDQMTVFNNLAGVGTDVNAIFWWRERPVEQEEFR